VSKVEWYDIAVIRSLILMLLIIGVFNCRWILWGCYGY